MITEYYILMGVLAVFGWLFILAWKDGIDKHLDTEEDEHNRLEDLKDKLKRENRL